MMKNTPKEEIRQPESNEREKALALFKIDYGELVKKYNWDIAAILTVDQNGIMPRIAFMDMVKKEEKK